jgi:hypothetical protein
LQLLTIDPTAGTLNDRYLKKEPAMRPKSKTPRTDPAIARAVQATENVWRAVESEFGLLSSPEVDTLLRASNASDLRQRGELLAILRRNGYVFPGFQFDHEAGAVRLWIAPLLTLAERNERSTADVIMWMMSPTTYFDGDRPADHVGDVQRLLSVAERTWSIEW